MRHVSGVGSIARRGDDEPTLGVLPLVLRARKRAFSAPRICTVLAGYLLRLVRDPAWLMRRAPIRSPSKAVRLGATRFIFSRSEERRVGKECA